MIAVLADCCCEDLVFYIVKSPHVSIFADIRDGSSPNTLELYVKYRIETIASDGVFWIDTSNVSDYIFLKSCSYSDSDFETCWNNLESYFLSYSYDYLRSYVPPSPIYSTFLGVNYKSVFREKMDFTVNTVSCVYDVYKIL